MGRNKSKIIKTVAIALLKFVGKSLLKTAVFVLWVLSNVATTLLQKFNNALKEYLFNKE